MKNLYLLISASLLLASCSSPQPGPDKTAAGGALGAGLGAGAGAVIGNQVGYTGEGIAIGAGFGLLSGALQGGAHDLNEAVQLEHERKLASIQAANRANRRELLRVQDTMDLLLASDTLGGVYQVFFDPDVTNLKSGSIANLEVIAESIKKDPAARVIHVVGHTDDTGDPKYNERLAEARAREVSSYLAARGISMDQIDVNSFGAKRPIASNATPTGRQLNRRVDVYISNR